MFSFRLYLKSCRVLLATALLFLGATSDVCAAQQSDRLQVLISETSAQFQLAFRLRPAEREQRQEQLEAAVAAWRAAPRTAANDEQFGSWLRTTIRSSMPGSRTAMPPLPAFKAIEQIVVKRPVEAAPVDSQRPAQIATPVEAKRSTPVAPIEVRKEEPFNIEDYAVESPLATRSRVKSETKNDPFLDDPAAE